jgi:carbon-monoxide dehydrogenase small subunit/xanthine dehydrogenase small subunit
VAESIEIAFTLNGRPLRMRVRSDQRLLDVLRQDLRLTGAKDGCGKGECGSCTVIVDSRAVNACLMMAYQADGVTVETVEGLAAGDELHPLQEAFIETGAVHCGACTAGFLMAAKAMFDAEPSTSARDARWLLAGNLCRCTGYAKIVQAASVVAGRLEPTRAVARSPGVAPSYFRPRSLEEALEILAQRPGEARPVAGATDLLARAGPGSAGLDALFDVTAVPEMQGIEERDSELWLGALTTYTDAAASPLVARHAPALRTACGLAGGPQVRNRATLGGSLARAAPWADPLPPLLAADAVVEIVSVSSRRDVPVDAFLSGPGETALAPDELIVGVRVPRREGVRGAFQRLAQRRGPAVAKISVAAAMTFKDGRPDWVRVAMGAAGETVTRCLATETALLGGGYDSLQRAKDAIREEARPVDDLRSSSEYRREMAAVLLERAVRELAES